MNYYTMQANRLAKHLYTEAREAVPTYADEHDREAEVMAVLAMALELAGGSNLLKPTEE